MSVKAILTLAAAAAIAAATFSSSTAYARGFAGGGNHFSGRAAGPSGGRTSLAMVHNSRRLPIVPIHPIFPGHPVVFHHHHDHHWVFRGGRWIILDGDVDTAVVTTPDVTPTPGPCTCLTKTYTPSGLVVFADVCTKESASAPVDDNADATQVPTTPVAATQVPISVVPTTPNYAGRTYEDYLAANPQTAQPQAANPQTPPAPQKN
jgi:hypothetical protein